MNGEAFVLRMICMSKTNATNVNIFCLHKHNEVACALIPFMSPVTNTFIALAGTFVISVSKYLSVAKKINVHSIGSVYY